jgi:hypothetical protein
MQYQFKKGKFLDEILNWKNRTHFYTKGKIGYINGAIKHKWHGSKKQRGFKARRRIINSPVLPFEPNTHIYYDTDGLIHFNVTVQTYYNHLTRKYFLSRNEDADHVNY